MKIEIKKCNRAQDFCDRRCARAIRTQGESACFVSEENDGQETLTITIVDRDKRKVYVLTPDQQKTVYEVSKDLLEFEVPTAPKPFQNGGYVARASC